MTIDVQKALANPAAVFSSPAAVTREESLSREQKIRILEQWEYDARELAVAEEENMTGGPPNRLHEVLQALRSLAAEHGTGRSPTKQGGP
jgi:hypothetical protein